jgi:hypothetical protein
MGVVEAKIQTVEDIYRLVWAAVAKRRPIAASYHGLPRLFCPHRLGRNKEGEVRVLCYQYGEKAKADSSRPVRPPTGAALYWRSSEE